MSQSKAVLLARLATARAALWRELVALDEDILCTQPITAAWTAKDILAHVAAWDNLHADRVELILLGRFDAIEHSDRDAKNAEIFAEREDWSLDRVIAEAQSARARFMSLLAPLSWADITREQHTPAGEKVSLVFLAERRARHDEVHTAEIRGWQEVAQPEDSPGPKSVLAAALDAGRDALLAWGGMVPTGQQSSRPVCGVWTWQDVLGHIADWEMFSVRGLRAMANGKLGGTDYDEEEERQNQELAAKRRGEPLAQTWQDFSQARQELLEILAGFDDRRLAREARTEVEDLDSYYYWFSTCFAHDYEHTLVLAETLGETGPASGAPIEQSSRPAPEVINLAQKFGAFAEIWSPKIVAELNGQQVKLARLQGEFIWHQHATEDEMFLVLKGRLTIKFRDRDVVLNEGELIVVPAGVEHMPVAAEEVQVLLLEPASTLNTGNVRDERTVEAPERI